MNIFGQDNDAISGDENDADGVEEVAPDDKESTEAAYKGLGMLSCMIVHI